jgi:hypothetical protein
MNSEQLPSLLALINRRIIGMLMDNRKLDNKRAGKMFVTVMKPSISRASE